MCLSPRVDITDRITGAHSVVVLFVDTLARIHMAPNFSDIEKNVDFTTERGLIGDPLSILRILYVLQYLASNIYLGLPKINEKTYDYRHGYSDGGRVRNSVEEYVEFVYAKDGGGLLGHRIYFIVRDPNYSFDRALMQYWTKMRESKGAKRIKITPDLGPVSPLKMPASQMAWVRDYLSPYTAGRFMDTADGSGDFGGATNDGLDMAGNPAGVTKCLTLEWSNEYITRRYGDVVNPVYTDITQYHVMEGSANGGHIIADFIDESIIQNIQTLRYINFPASAYPILYSNRDPKIAMYSDISRPPMTAADMVELKYGPQTDDVTRARLEDEMSIREANRMALASGHLRDSTGAPPPVSQSLIQARECFRLARDRCATPEEYYEFTCSREAADVCISAQFNDPKNPAGAEIYTWYQELLKSSPSFCTVQPRMYTVDSTLSEFGNLMVTRMLDSEYNGGGIAVLHKEILMTQLARCIAGDIGPEKLRFHLMFTGPPGSGKSFIMTKNGETSITGSTRAISHQTEQANSTDMCMNGLQIHVDEAPMSFTGNGKDGTGNAQLKTTLSSGVVVSETCVVDTELQRRISIVTKSERKCQMFVASNLKRSAFAEAIADRFYMCSVPEQSRDDCDPILESLRLESNPNMKADNDAYNRYWQIVQFLSCMTWVRINVDPHFFIQMELVLKLSSVTFRYLKEAHGIDVSKRDRERIMMLTRALTIFHAINKVFMSGDVIKEGEIFDETMISKLLPYLISTREHFYMAFSMMDQVVVDPSHMIILEGIRAYLNTLPTDTRFSPNSTDRSSTDYNFYAILLPPSVLANDVIYAVSKLVVGHIANTTNYKLSADAVSDIISGLVRRTIRVRLFSPTNEITDEVVSVPTARIRGHGYKHGLEISRQYLDHTLGHKMDIVNDAIRATFDPFMSISRVVTGQSMRYGYKSDAASTLPFIFKVIDVGAVDHLPRIRMPKDDHVASVKHFLANGYSMEPVTAFETMNESIDDIYADRWYTDCGVRPFEEPSHHGGADLGRYPECIIDRYIEEHKGAREASRGDMVYGMMGDIISY